MVGYSSLICGLPVIRPELEFSFGECLGDLASTQLDEQGEPTFARCPHAEQRCPNPNLPECIPKLASSGRVKVQPVHGQPNLRHSNGLALLLGAGTEDLRIGYRRASDGPRGGHLRRTLCQNAPVVAGEWPSS